MSKSPIIIIVFLSVHLLRSVTICLVYLIAPTLVACIFIKYFSMIWPHHYIMTFFVSSYYFWLKVYFLKLFFLLSSLLSSEWIIIKFLNLIFFIYSPWLSLLLIFFILVFVFFSVRFLKIISLSLLYFLFCYGIVFLSLWNFLSVFFIAHWLP